jgi:hypothetical protein
LGSGKHLGGHEIDLKSKSVIYKKFGEETQARTRFLQVI